MGSPYLARHRWGYPVMSPRISVSSSSLLAVTGLTLSLIYVGSADAASRSAEDLAIQLLEQSGIDHGACAILGCENADLPVAISRVGDFFVHVQDSDAENVSATRGLLIESGLYGKRAFAERGALRKLPYARNTIDLLVAAELDGEALETLSYHEVMRVLRPGGKALLGNPAAGESLETDVEAWLQASSGAADSASVEADGTWVTLTKPQPEGVDAWSHWEHGPDNNPVSTDEVIKAPYMTQWLGLPYYIAMPAVSLSAGGRVFIAMGHIAHHEREERWLNTILARNGYNGTELWTRKLPDGYLVHRSAFIATEDTFYMIDPNGSGCLLLDPETGYEKDRIQMPRLRGDWKWMAKDGDTLYVLVGDEKDPSETTVVRSKLTHWSWGELSKGYYADRVPWGFGTTVAAIDLKRKRTLWTHREDEPIDSRAMVLGDGELFLYCPDSHLRCLTAQSGDIRWTNEDSKVRELIEEPGVGLSSTPGFRSTCLCVFSPDVLFYQAQTRMNVVAVSRHDGQLLWHRKKITNNPNVVIADGKLVVGLGPEGSTLVMEPKTGEVLEDLGFAKRSCARLTATPDSFFCRGTPDGLTRYDRINRRVLFNGAVRPACNDGAIAANGLLYLGPWLCDCNLSLMGRLSLCSAGDFNFEANAADEDRLERSARLDSGIEPLEVSASDWPVYRASNSRNASSKADIEMDATRVWTFEPKHPFRPTAPVATGGMVFLGGDDGLIRGLDAASGTLKWTFPTSGPILHAPAIWNSRLYAGSGDGYIYALEAATGRLLWRFRAAPAERRIMVYGTLCSTWPVNTGVIVQDGIAYAAAGIVDYDGTYVYALDAVTGEIRWQNDTSGHIDKDLRKGVSAQGTLAIAGGKLWMPGGNVVSPAVYRLDDGEYVGGSPFDGSPRSNRGEEIGILNDRFVLLGGRLRYSATENVVNPGVFHAIRMQSDMDASPRLPFSNGKIAPAWNDGRVYAVSGLQAMPACYKTDTVDEYLNCGDAEVGPGVMKAAWTAHALSGRDTVTLIAAKNALLSVNERSMFRDLRSVWALSAISPEDGALLWDETLAAPAVPSGALVDRDGRVIVALEGGKIDCFSGDQAMRSFLASVQSLSKDDPSYKANAIKQLRDSLAYARTAGPRERLIASLAELGYEVGRDAEENGYITRWTLTGAVPWRPGKDESDIAFLAFRGLSDSNSTTVGDRSYHWRDHRSSRPHGMVELVSLYGSEEWIAAYAYSEFELPEARDLTLMIGSNDGFCCWLNGEEVGRFEGGRSYAPDQSIVETRAKAGLNRVLLKITQQGASWAFSARLTDTQGQPIDPAGATRSE